MHKASVSVIIPVYNCETYLRGCLDSVISQSMLDIEIIIINDSSVDGSGSIIDEYSKSEERIHVIELTENKGVSVARNMGLEKATGEYLIFIDADDYWTDSGMLKYLCDVARADKSDFVMFGYYMLDNSGQRSIGKMLSPGLIDMRTSKKWNVSYIVPCLLISRKLVYRFDIRFEPGLESGEDALFCYKLYCYAEKFSKTDKVYYCARVNSDGVTFSGWSSRKLFCAALWFDPAIVVVSNSPAYKRHPELLTVLARERLERLTNVLAFEALKILDEKELRDFIGVWARCFAHINQLLSGKFLQLDSLSTLQMKTIKAVMKKDINKFRKLFTANMNSRLQQ